MVVQVGYTKFCASIVLCTYLVREVDWCCFADSLKLIDAKDMWESWNGLGNSEIRL